MKKKEIKQLFDSFKNMTVLIVGDSMIDSYMWGKIERQSPEAPVPVVKIEKHENRLGGAANVARNIKSLGAKPILCSVIGDDYKGYELKKLLEQEKVAIDGIIHELGRKTTTKTRVISDNKHQLRIDEEQVKPINSEEKLLTIVYENMQNTDVIILQDYNKGVLTPKVIEEIIKKANKLEIPTIIDPKIKNFNSYRNCTVFKPNLKEIKIGCNINFNENNISEIKSATIDLLKKMNAEGILLTLSDKGICIQTKNKFYHTKAEEREIIDVSGAGDTVISTAALCLAAKIDNLHLSQFANLSGGLVCEEVGVVPVDKSNLYNASIAYFTKYNDS